MLSFKETISQFNSAREDISSSRDDVSESLVSAEEQALERLIQCETQTASETISKIEAVSQYYEDAIPNEVLAPLLQTLRTQIESLAA